MQPSGMRTEACWERLNVVRAAVSPMVAVGVECSPKVSEEPKRLTSPPGRAAGGEMWSRWGAEGVCGSCLPGLEEGCHDPDSSVDRG